MPALVTTGAGGFCYGHWYSSDRPVSDPTGAALLWLGWGAGVPRRHLGRGLLGGSACDAEGASRTPNDGHSWGLALHEGSGWAWAAGSRASSCGAAQCDMNLRVTGMSSFCLTLSPKGKQGFPAAQKSPGLARLGSCKLGSEMLLLS